MKSCFTRSLIESSCTLVYRLGELVGVSREEVRQELMLKALSRGDVSYALNMCRYLIKNLWTLLIICACNCVAIVYKRSKHYRYIGTLRYLDRHLFKSVKSREISHVQHFSQTDYINKFSCLSKKNFTLNARRVIFHISKHLSMMHSVQRLLWIGHVNKESSANFGKLSTISWRFPKMLRDG